MHFTKQDVLNTAWNQLFTYQQAVDYANEMYVYDVPTEQEYNAFWLTKTGAK